MLCTWYQPRQVEVGQMASDAEVAMSGQFAAQRVTERAAKYTSGLLMLALALVLLAAGIVALWEVGRHTQDTATALAWAGVILVTLSVLVWLGLTPVAPGQARVVQLFGKYRGTI